MKGSEIMTMTRSKELKMLQATSKALRADQPIAIRTKMREQESGRCLDLTEKGQARNISSLIENSKVPMRLE